MKHKMPLLRLNKYICLLIFMATFSFAYAQAPKYSNEFLAIGVGARGLGMSGAQAASVNDVTAAYWNPAGLQGLSKAPQIALMHSEYFAGIAKYDYGSFGKRIDSNSVIAFSAIRFGVDDIPNTTELIDANGNVNYDRITKFSAADYAFIASYARNIKKVKGLTFGANAKVIHRVIGDFAKSWGFGLDAGIQYRNNNWVFGASGKDITTTFNAWSYSLSDKMKEVFSVTGNIIPENSMELTMPRIILGAGRNFKINKTFTALAEINFDVTTDGYRNVLIKSNPFSVDPKMGVEIGIASIIFPRIGVCNIQQSTDIFGKGITTFQPTCGIGVRFRSIHVDYAFTDIGDQSVALYSHVISLKFDISRKPSKL